MNKKLIQEHQESWEKDFNKLKRMYEESIPIRGIQIEHIGSTSIKGLAAKPIIDIDIVYENPTFFKAIKQSLEEIGYYHNGNQGIMGREVFKRKKKETKHGILDSIQHHLYVCHIKNEELQRHLTFRNYLRENLKERKEYEELKFRIAELTKQDRKAYAKMKEEMASEFVEWIIFKSEGLES